MKLSKALMVLGIVSAVVVTVAFASGRNSIQGPTDMDENSSGGMQGSQMNMAQDGMSGMNMAQDGMSEMNMDMDMIMAQGMDMGMMIAMHQGMNQGSGYGKAILKFIGADDIMKTYNLKIEKAVLNADLERIEYKEKMMDLMGSLRDATEKYQDNPAKYGEEIVEILKELKEGKKLIHEINIELKEEIVAINMERRAEIDKAVDEWLVDLEGNIDEMEKFVDFVNPLLNNMH